MANTLNIAASLQSVITGGGGFTGSGSAGLAQAGTHNIGNVQSIATVDTTINVGSLANIGYIIIKNLDPTNYVEVDSASTYDKFPQKILPLGFILLSPETTAIHAKAHTAACDCEIVACEL